MYEMLSTDTKTLSWTFSFQNLIRKIHGHDADPIDINFLLPGFLKPLTAMEIEFLINMIIDKQGRK